jgi:hypothetical protein
LAVNACEPRPDTARWLARNGVKRHSAESCVIVTPVTDANYQVTFNAVSSTAVVV